jgi:hypothetical protein
MITSVLYIKSRPTTLLPVYPYQNLRYAITDRNDSNKRILTLLSDWLILLHTRRNVCHDPVHGSQEELLCVKVGSTEGEKVQL